MTLPTMSGRDLLHSRRTKLTLNKTTLKALNDESLQQVQGGALLPATIVTTTTAIPSVVIIWYTVATIAYYGWNTSICFEPGPSPATQPQLPPPSPQRPPILTPIMGA